MPHNEEKFTCDLVETELKSVTAKSLNSFVSSKFQYQTKVYSSAIVGHIKQISKKHIYFSGKTSNTFLTLFLARN